MPTYEYACNDCAHNFEITQKFSDAALTTCPECDGGLRKVFSPVGVVFKGSGFYATDNRTKGATAASSTKKDATTSSDSSSTTSSTPAAAPASKPASTSTPAA